jgi:hypothetical protein
MTFEPLPFKFPYSKTWHTFKGFTEEGRPETTKQTETVRLGNFDDYFIHMLSDHLPTIEMNPHGDGLDRLQQFRKLYIQCLLEAQREYVKDCYTPP